MEKPKFQDPELAKYNSSLMRRRRGAECESVLGERSRAEVRCENANPDYSQSLQFVTFQI